MMMTTATLLGSGRAFQNTWPHLLLHGKESGSGGDFMARAEEAVRECPSALLLINQPGLDASDLSSHTTPHLHRLSEQKGASLYPHVHNAPSGAVDQLQALAEEHCGATVQTITAGAQDMRQPGFDGIPPVAGIQHALRLDFSPLARSQPLRAQQVAQHDAYLQSLLEGMNMDNMTLIYASSPAPGHLRRRQEGAAARGLFSRFAFFTPGILMALTVALVLLPILAVALTALSSIEISYLAFRKQ